ncbi:hypothetical protein K1719_000494 [Acacia pycnantha]|nr:hypothetical protein K1719_000494 [Acacia pycnantha]
MEHQKSSKEELFQFASRFQCNNNECPLAILVLDFTIQLVEIGVENNCLLALIIFSLQHVLINHEPWKYKMKHLCSSNSLVIKELIVPMVLTLMDPPPPLMAGGNLFNATPLVLLQLQSLFKVTDYFNLKSISLV